MITLEAGWTVSEVGRQPWIVYEKMKVEDAATANTGIWITFIGVLVLYVGLGITTILVLRSMSRRFRDGDGFDEPMSPYGPSEAARPSARRRADEHHRRRHPVRGGHRRTRSSAAPTSVPASGTSSPAAPKRGERPREVIDHSIAPVWEANHVWLIFVFVVLWTCFPEAYASITLTLFVPLTLAALGIVLRGASFAFRKAVLRTRDQRNFGAAFALSSVLVPYCLGAVVGQHRLGPRPRGRARPVIPGAAGSTPPPILGGVLAVCVAAYLAAVLPGLGRPAALRRGDGRLLPASAPRRGVVAGRVGCVGIFVLHARRRPTSSTG